EDVAEGQVLDPCDRNRRLHRRRRRNAAVHALRADRTGRQQREDECGKRGFGSSVHDASPYLSGGTALTAKRRVRLDLLYQRNRQGTCQSAWFFDDRQYSIQRDG